MLRAVTIEIGPLNSKFLGFVVMAAAIAILFVLPWLDKSPVKSIRFKGLFSRIALIVFAASFVILGYLGLNLLMRRARCSHKFAPLCTSCISSVCLSGPSAKNLACARPCTS